MGKHGLKALGLMFLAALCLTAFMASSASANWRVAGAENTVNKEVLVSTHEVGTLLVPSLGLAISCPGIKGEDLLLLAKSSETTGKLSFSECTTKVNGVANAKCNPINQPIKAGGKGHLVLIGTKNLVLFEQTNEATPFATIEFGAECAVTETNNVTGKLLAECLKGALVAADCSEEEASHLLRQQTRTEDELKFGKRPASIDGVAKVELAEKGKLFSGVI